MKPDGSISATTLISWQKNRPTTQREYSDPKQPGLRFRVSPKGKVSFRVQYQVNGKRRAIAIGRFPDVKLGDARKRAREILGQVAKGEDPVRERLREERRRANEITVSEAVERFIAEHVIPNKRSDKEDRRYLARLCQGRATSRTGLIADVPISELERADVKAQLAREKARSNARWHRQNDAKPEGTREDKQNASVGVAVNRWLASVHKFFAWAAQEELISHNPARDIPKPASEHKRDRHLLRSELGDYWNRLDQCPMTRQTVLALRLQLLTGLRIGEVTGLSRMWVRTGESQPYIAIPRKYMKRHRSGETFMVPLSGLAIEVICEAEALLSEGDMFLFQSPGSDAPITSEAPQRALRKSQHVFGFCEPVRTHDIRRTVTTVLREHRVSLPVVDMLLDHKPQGVTQQHYDKHTLFPEREEALTLLADVVLQAAAEARSRELAL